MTVQSKQLVLGVATLFALNRFKGNRKMVLVVALLLQLLSKFSAARSIIKTKFTNYPIIGNDPRYLMLLMNSITKTCFDFSKELKYKSFDMHFMGGLDFFIANDAVDRKFVLKDEWKKFTKNVDGVGFGKNFHEVMGGGIFAVDGEEWNNHRKAASFMFSKNALRGKMEHVFVSHADLLVRYLKEYEKSGEVFDMQTLMASFTFDTICEIAFGENPGALDSAAHGEKSKFLIAFDEVQQIAYVRFVQPDFVWETRRALNIGEEKTLKKHMQYMQSYLDQIIANRKQELENPNEAETKQDLLSLYIRYARDKKQPHMLKEKYLQDVILNFMIAGRDTTSCTLTNFFKLVDTNPVAEKRLCAEFEQLVPEGQTATLDKMREASFADACFNETLRMYPPVGTDTRFAAEDIELPSGATVKKGWMVVIPNYTIGRNPNHWDTPDVWNPNRWLEWDNGKYLKKIPEYLLPVFWAGPRICLGKDMARFEVKVVMQTVLKQFKIHPFDHREEFINGPIIFYKDGLPCRVTKR